MRRMILALTLSAVYSFSFAVAPSTKSGTTSSSPGIIWISITPHPNGDYTKGYAQISVSVGGVKVISSYSMTKNNATAPFLVGLPYYDSVATPITVTSEKTSILSSNSAASILDIRQGNRPFYSSPTLLLCGKNFSSC